MRVSKEMLQMRFKHYAHVIEGAGLSTEGLSLIHGSKHFGNSFKVVFVDPETGGHSSAPGSEFGGFIGWTKREAYDALSYMARVIEDIAYRKNLSE